MTRADYLQELIDKTDDPELKARLKTKMFLLTEKKDPTERVMEKIKELKVLTKTIWDLDDCPIILFDLKGRAAGQYVRKPGYSAIRFNKQLLENNTDDFINRTVPHEWAHFVARTISKTRIKPHGKEWRTVCMLLGMEDITVYHNYEVTSARRVETFTYACGCRIHTITKVKHNRIKRGAKYVCRECGQFLEEVRQG